MRTVIQEDAGTWKAIGYLRELQKIIPGTDFRVRYDISNLPDVIGWMTPFMKQNLIRYGDVLCLDTQKRQYNHIGWPYIAPCVKNGDMKVIVTSEAIVVTEDLDLYAWILKSQEEMEPR